jgi:hypothetical protein
MDLAKSGLIRKLIIKWRGAEVFRQIGTFPMSYESNFISPHQLVQLLAIRILIPHTGMKFIAP